LERGRREIDYVIADHERRSRSLIQKTLADAYESHRRFTVGDRSDRLALGGSGAWKSIAKAFSAAAHSSTESVLA